MRRLPHRPRIVGPVLAGLTALAGCVGGSGDGVAFEPGAVDAALNEIGADVKDGSAQTVSSEDCVVLDGDDVLDAFVDAEVLGAGDVEDASAEMSSTVSGLWGSFAVDCEHPLVAFSVTNGGPDDRDELIEFTQAATETTDQQVEPVEIDGIDDSRTYEVRVDGETRRLGWIDDEMNVEVSHRDAPGSVEVDDLATALTTVLELLDAEYGDTEAVDRPDEPPIDLGTIRDGLRELGGDAGEDLLNGERFDSCPIASLDDVADLVEEAGLDGRDLVEQTGFVQGSNAFTNVQAQCPFVSEDASVSIGASLVDTDGLDDLLRVQEDLDLDGPERTFDIEATVEGLPDGTVYSLRSGDDGVGAGVLSGEVLVTITVGRGDVDEDALLAVLPSLVELVTAEIG